MEAEHFLTGEGAAIAKDEAARRERAKLKSMLLRKEGGEGSSRGSRCMEAREGSD